MLLDEEADELVFEAVAGEGSETLIGQRFPSSTGIGGWVLVTRQPLVIEDLRQDPRFDRGTAEKTGYVPEGMMCVPLLYDERALGVLYVLDRPQDSRFTLAEMDLLGLFGNQAAIALQLLQRARRVQGLMEGATGDDVAAVAQLAEAVDKLEDEKRAAGVQLIRSIEGSCGDRVRAQFVAERRASHRRAHGARAVDGLLREARGRFALRVAETHGVAHFVEHMLFCGTPRRPSVRALAGEVDAIGGLFNAGTSKEWTSYYVKCASDYAPQAVDVLADMLRNSLVEESEVEREKRVIVEEIRAKFDTPRDYVDEYFELLIYGDTPLGRFRIGTEETVRAATRETLVDFVGRMYEPSRLRRRPRGQVRTSRSLRPSGSCSATSTASGLRRRRAARPAPNGERILLDTKPIDQAHVCLGLRAYPSPHPDRYAVQLMATILGGGMSSRLTEELTMRQGLAYSVFAVSHGHTDAGGLWAQGGVNVDKVDEAISAMRTELRGSARTPSATPSSRKPATSRRGALRSPSRRHRG